MNTDVIGKDWAGRYVGERYCLVQWLGGVGQSGVYLCNIDGNEEQKAAIKLLPASVEDAAARMARWNTAAGLNHPHLIRVLDMGRGQIGDTAVLYVVTEYAGEILSEILPGRSLSVAETREMMAPLLDALSYLHEKGLVHSRLKPSNIMVVDDQLKLASDDVRATEVAVTPPQVLDVYDAPEVERGLISAAADMWSLGVVLVEVLTRTPPEWNRSAQIPPIIPPSLPKPFAQIARECLRLDPANRCTLEEVRAHLDSGAAIPHRPLRPKSKAGLMAAAGVVLVVVLGVAVMHFHHAVPAPGASEQTSGPAGQNSPSQDSSPPQSAQGPVSGQETRPRSKGSVARRVMPDVPEEARSTIQGTVKVSIQLKMDANGSVDEASIDSQGPSSYFANLALAAARGWKFTPAQMNGQDVRSVWLLEFEFRQSGTDVTATEKFP